MQTKRHAIPIKHCVHLALLIIIALYAFSRLLNAPTDESVYGGDISQVVCGWNFHEWFLRDSILNNGTVPLWFRYRYSGYIWAGDPQMPTYSISTILLLLSPNEWTGMRYGIALHGVMSGVFMYLLLVVWKQRPEASLIGAVGFMLSGFYFGRIHAGHITFLYAYPWIPLVIALHELSIQRNSTKFSALAGLSLSMQLQSGGLAIFLYTLIPLVIYFLHRMGVQILPSIRNGAALLHVARQHAKFLFVTALFASTFSAIKILPVVEEMAYTGRGMFLETGTVLKGYVSSWNQLQELLMYKGQGSSVFPYTTFPRWGVWDWWEYWFYLGPLILILGIIGISQVRRNPTPAFLVFSTAISIFLARGTLIQPIAQLLPFTALIHIPSRFLVITQFTIPALATMTVTAAQELWQEKVQRSKHAASLLLTHANKLIAYGLTLILIMDLVPTGTSLIWTTPVGQRVTPAMEYIRSASPNEVYRIHTVDTAYVYDYSRNGFELTRELGWEFAIQMYIRYFEAAEPGAYKMFGPLNTKYVLSSSPITSPDGLRLERVFPDATHVYLNTFYMTRLWTFYRAVLVVSSDRAFWESEAIALLKNPVLNPQMTLLVRGEFVDDFTLDTLRKFDVIYLPSTASPPARSLSKAKELLKQYSESGGTIAEPSKPIPEEAWTRLSSENTPSQPKITGYNPNWLEASITLEKPAFLFVSEVYVSGWHLYVDGLQAQIYQMDDIFFGTLLNEGRHTLRVEFNPTSYQAGTIFTGLTLLAVAILLTRHLWKTPIHAMSERIRKSRLSNKKS